MARSNNGASSLPVDVRVARIALAVAAFGLLLIGFVMVYSTTSVDLIDAGKDPLSDLKSQVAFALIGVVSVVLLWKFIPYTAWVTRAVWIVWFAGVVFLVLTAFIGTELYGAKRWLQIGPIGFQPSEFVKIALLLMAVRVLYDFRAGSIEVKAAGIQVIILVLAPLAVHVRLSIRSRHDAHLRGGDPRRHMARRRVDALYDRFVPRRARRRALFHLRGRLSRRSHGLPRSLERRSRRVTGRASTSYARITP